VALTIVVRSIAGRERDGDRALPSITVDAPRVVIGRGDGCEVRLPDLSLAHRHASVRQRGGEYVVVDEGSQNGTFVQKLRLPPQTPRVIQSGELVRLGRVWIEIRIEPAAAVSRSPAAAAKELALELCARSLLGEGEVPWPKVTVVEGPDRGATLVVEELARTYSIGRSRECDLVLTDPQAGRRHATVIRRGDALGVQDLGSSHETLLDGAPIGQGEIAWRAGQELLISGTRLALAYPAADALAEIERSPEERLKADEVIDPPASADAKVAATGDALVETPEATDASDDAAAAPRAMATTSRAAPPKSTWRAADGAVVLVALGVLAVSIAAAFWLFGR
jgi:pSer/pThr/pTyr-binding forkhead associated (FHA) protein